MFLEAMFQQFSRGTRSAPGTGCVHFARQPCPPPEKTEVTPLTVVSGHAWEGREDRALEIESLKVIAWTNNTNMESAKWFSKSLFEPPTCKATKIMK